MAVVVVRTALFYFITILSLRIMGKRQIGELEPTELVVTILISDIATLCLQDINIPVLFAIVPIVMLVAFEMLSSAASLKSMCFRNFLAGTYNVIIDNGVLDQSEMAKAQLTLDELMEEIRQKGALSISDVRFCILETSGRMSVIMKGDTERKKIPVPLVVDGKILKKNLRYTGISKDKLRSMLKKEGATDTRDVFWFAVEDNKTSFVRKER